MAPGDCSFSSDRTFGCLLISAPQGRSGKTIATIGLCDGLRRRGLFIQPFKKGPDYIDPSWLTIAAGRSCRNLDLFLIPEDKLVQAFKHACEGTDLALVEGAMGLYDGLDNQKTTAEIARLLDIPILLVVNTSRMTSSIAAMVKGYQLFQPDVKIAGVILNYVSGPRHEEKLREAVEQHCGIPVVGSIPRDADLLVAERHLGLIPAPESAESKSLVERIGHKLESCFDLDRILAIARGTTAPRAPSHFPKERKKDESPLPFGERDRVRGTTGTKNVHIGILRDRVFNFYYPENFEALKKAGAQLLFIDSLTDRLPELDGLYIGGGFPEFFLKELEGNDGLRKDIAGAVEEGLPVYAECAGLMYLCRSISWQDRSYEMARIIPADVELSQKPEGHGYVVAEVVGENPFFPTGLTIRGHEFHHSNLSNTGGLKFAYQIKRGRGIDGSQDGVVYKNLFASYIHLHALGTPEWAQGFVSLASKLKRSSRQVNALKEGAGLT
jgi:cobyrinic acid a,c-diamide synthase